MSAGRRPFLKILAGAIAMVPCYLSLRVLLDLFRVGAAANGERIFLGTFRDVTERLESGRAGYYVDDRRKLLVVRDGEASGAPGLSVYSLVCTHLGCTLRPGKDDLFLECPCHGSKFHLREPLEARSACGRVHRGPASVDLTRYQVVTIKDRIFLHS